MGTNLNCKKALTTQTWEVVFYFMSGSWFEIYSLFSQKVSPRGIAPSRPLCWGPVRR